MRRTLSTGTYSLRGGDSDSDDEINAVGDGVDQAAQLAADIEKQKQRLTNCLEGNDAISVEDIKAGDMDLDAYRNFFIELIVSSVKLYESVNDDFLNSVSSSHELHEQLR